MHTLFLHKITLFGLFIAAILFSTASIAEAGQPLATEITLTPGGGGIHYNVPGKPAKGTRIGFTFTCEFTSDVGPNTNIVIMPKKNFGPANQIKGLNNDTKHVEFQWRLKDRNEDNGNIYLSILTGTQPVKVKCVQVLQKTEPDIGSD